MLDSVTTKIRTVIYGTFFASSDMVEYSSEFWALHGATLYITFDQCSVIYDRVAAL
jgi:hypothetical protein